MTCRLILAALTTAALCWLSPRVALIATLVLGGIGLAVWAIGTAFVVAMLRQPREQARQQGADLDEASFHNDLIAPGAQRNHG